MNIIPLLVCWGSILCCVLADDKSYQSSMPSWDAVNGMTGVANVAAVAARNGRVSSSGGVKLYSAPDDTVKYLGVQSNDPYFPIYVSHSSDGRSASASVQYSPGSVMVSSSTASEYNPKFNTWIPPYQPPIIDNRIYRYPEEIYEHTRQFHHWLSKHIFKYASPPKISPTYKGAWSYPSFNPFESFWR